VGYVDRLVREAIGMQLRSGRRIQINPSMEPCHEHYKPVTLTVLIILDRVAREKKNNRQRLAGRQTGPFSRFNIIITSTTVQIGPWLLSLQSSTPLYPTPSTSSF
jgi:hypothetical protein